MPRQVMIGVNHTGAGFTKRRFNQGETPPKMVGTQSVVKPTATAEKKPKVSRRRLIVKPPRVNIPPDFQIREIAKLAARQSAFRERRQKNLERLELLVQRGLADDPSEEAVNRLTDFQKFYRIVAAKLRRYGGKHPIYIDIYLALREYVHEARKGCRSLTLDELRTYAERHIAGREALIVKMADEGELVDRPMAPKDAREKGGEAYTEAAAKRRKDARRIDRITVRSRLPGSSEDLFITLGRSTKKVNGRRVPCPRRVFAIQTEAEWNAWRKSRIREKRQDFRNHGSRRAQDAN